MTAQTRAAERTRKRARRQRRTHTSTGASGGTEQLAIEGQTQLHDRGADVHGDISNIPRTQIYTAKNPRRVVHDDDFNLLVQSIRQDGILSAVTVLRHSPEEPDRYELLLGAQRLKAAEHLDLDTVPAHILRPYANEKTEIEKLVLRGIENMRRSDMDPLDEAVMFAEVRDQIGASASEDTIAEMFAVPRERVRRRLQLLVLPEETQRQLNSRNLTLGTALSALVPIAEHSQALARSVTTRLADGRIDQHDLQRDPGTTLRILASDETLESDVLLLPWMGGLDTHDAQFVLDRCLAYTGQKNPDLWEQQLAELRKVSHVGPHDPQLAVDDRITLPVTPEDEARARAAGELYESRIDRYQAITLLTGPHFAMQWLVEGLERHHKLGIDQTAADNRDPHAQPKPVGRKEKLAETLGAQHANHHLGLELKKRHGDDTVSMNVAQAIASLLVDRHGREMINGLRLCDPEWMRVEVKMQAHGQTRETRSLASLDDAEERFERYLENAAGGEDLINRLFCAIVASALADPLPLPQHQSHLIELPFSEGREQKTVGKGRNALWQEVQDSLPERLSHQHRDEFVAQAPHSKQRDRLSR